MKFKLRIPKSNAILDSPTSYNGIQIGKFDSVLLCSSFDLLHPGHIRIMELSKMVGKKLIIGFNTDPDLKSPVQSVYERWKQVSAIKYVDEITPYSGDEDLLKLLRSTDYSVRALGEDYIGKQHAGIEYEDTVDIPTIYFDRSHGFSTSELRARIKRDY